MAAPARNGNVAIWQEFNSALARNTADAFELFIQRHPTHPLAREARWRERLLKNGHSNK